MLVEELKYGYIKASEEVGADLLEDEEEDNEDKEEDDDDTDKELES